ncbi:hypothetical protein JCM21900_002759 [Sporobolomyces salmonicolor]
MRLVGVPLCLYLLANLAQAQHQLTFGLSTGQDFTQDPADQSANARSGAQRGAQVGADKQRRRPSFAPDATPSSLSASDVHALALSLLDALTAHSPPNPPTSYAPHLSRSSRSSLSALLDSLESTLGSTTTGAALRGVRRGASYLYAGDSGKRKASGARDWSIRGAVRGLKHAVEAFAVDKPSSRGKKGTSTVEEGAQGWKKRLEMAQIKGGIVLTDAEVEEGMKEVVRLATEAGEKGSAEAWVLLGDLYLTGHLTLPANSTAAVDAYTAASEGWGIPEAQYKLGYLYGSNYGGADGGVEGEGQQGSALLHYTFAALSRHVPASMTVGYRHWAGIGTKQSCQDALPWYKAAADAAVRTFNSGPPGGRHLPPPKLRLSDISGGAFGPGASSSRTTLSTGGSTSQTAQEWSDLVEFHQFHAERGDPAYMFRLGRLYYQGFGAGGMGGQRTARGRLRVGEKGLQDGLWDGGRDFGRASKWFLRLARKYWPADPREATWNPVWGKLGASVSPKTGEQPKVGYYDPAKDRRNDKADDQTAMVAGLAAGYLGRMYLRGEGVNVNYAKAFLWFKRGTTQGDRESNNGLGIMYRDGLGVERNLKTATMLFHAAAQQDLAEAQVNLGKYYFGTGDFVMATTFFEHAIRADGIRIPDTFQAYYYLAELAARSSSTRPAQAAHDSCPVAVAFYKKVAERGDWEHEVWWEAERARERGDERTALLGYWIMAERGYEVAQNNVAWILDRDKSRLRLPFLDPLLPASNATDRLALAYWTRSAAQDNVDALVKMGDYYYKGIGTGEDGPQMEKAAACYQSAATSRFSALAMWNLGWMHETGQGVPQDFHLAKRYLDSALEVSSDAYFPVTLSLLSLYARALYHGLFHSPDDELNALALFGRDPNPDQVAAQAAGYAGQGGWTMGRAWRDIQRNWGVDPGPEPEVLPLHQQPHGAPPGGEGAGAPAENDLRAERRELEAGDPPLEWDHYGQHRAGGHAGEEGDDEFFVEDEGDFGGTVAIVALCMLLGWLLYFRQRPAQPHPPPPRQAAVPAAPAPAPGPVPPPQQQPQATASSAPTPIARATGEGERPREEEDERREE